MLQKNLIFILTIILLNCIKNECRTIQCYSCSDCANASLSNVNILTTTDDQDQCMKTIMLSSRDYNRERNIVSRGASSNCRPYSNERISIVCCRFDFCNA